MRWRPDPAFVVGFAVGFLVARFLIFREVDRTLATDPLQTLIERAYDARTRRANSDTLPITRPEWAVRRPNGRGH